MAARRRRGDCVSQKLTSWWVSIAIVAAERGPKILGRGGRLRRQARRQGGRCDPAAAGVVAVDPRLDTAAAAAAGASSAGGGGSTPIGIREGAGGDLAAQGADGRHRPGGRRAGLPRVPAEPARAQVAQGQAVPEWWARRGGGDRRVAGAAADAFAVSGLGEE